MHNGFYNELDVIKKECNDVNVIKIRVDWTKISVGSFFMTKIPLS